MSKIKSLLSVISLSAFFMFSSCSNVLHELYPKVFTCPGCGTEYESESEMNDCEKTSGCAKYYKCPNCGEGYSTVEKLEYCGNKLGCPWYVAYKFHEVPEVLPEGTDGNFGPEGKYVLFGDMPLIAKTSIQVDENKTISAGSSNNVYCLGKDGNWYKYDAGNYWLVQPIKWCIISKSADGKSLLLSETKLGVCSFYYTGDNEIRNIDDKIIYPDNYKYSTVRAYLNGAYEGGDSQPRTYEGDGLLQNLFTSKAQNFIYVTEVDNSIDSCFYDDKYIPKVNDDHICENTFDKMFILSSMEYSSSIYGIGNNALYFKKNYGCPHPYLEDVERLPFRNSYQTRTPSGASYSPYHDEECFSTVFSCFDNGGSGLSYTFPVNFRVAVVPAITVVIP